MNSPTARHIGVLLAAGRGRRMGVTKQLLPWPPADGPLAGLSDQHSELRAHATPPATADLRQAGNARTKTVVEAAFDVIAPHCAQMIVVLGHDVADIVEALSPREFSIVLSDPDAELLHSIRLGLVEAQRLGEGRPVLMHLADMPGAGEQTVRMLLREAAASENAARAVMPQYDGRGGHPVVVPTKLIHGIVTWQGPGGLREYWRQRAAQVRRVPVDDCRVVHDLDEPGDYASAVRS